MPRLPSTARRLATAVRWPAGVTATSWARSGDIHTRSVHESADT